VENITNFVANYQPLTDVLIHMPSSALHFREVNFGIAALAALLWSP